MDMEEFKRSMKVHAQSLSDEGFVEEEEDGIEDDSTFDESLYARLSLSCELLEEVGTLLDAISDLEVGKPFTESMKQAIQLKSDEIFDFLKQEAKIEQEMARKILEGDL